MESVPRPVAVARSSAGNQRPASLVVAPSTSGWPIAMPAWEMNTRVKLDAKIPLVSANTAVRMAPTVTEARIPQVSISHAEGRKIRM